MITSHDLAIKGHVTTVAQLAWRVSVSDAETMLSAVEDVPAILEMTGERGVWAEIAEDYPKHLAMVRAFIAFRRELDAIWGAGELVAPATFAAAAGQADERLAVFNWEDERP